ncbi:hypothetical protein C8F01DRAFT_1085108 [Mycena amicta]|nr:hypothetical protein C8F01DRAFT_1085108 [Mycena amicta]
MDKMYCVNVSATPYTGLLAFIIFLELAAYLAAHRTPIHNRGPWVEIGPGFWTRAWRTMLRVIGWHLAAPADPYSTRRRHPCPRAHQHPTHHCPHQQGNPAPRPTHQAMPRDAPTQHPGPAPRAQNHPHGQPIRFDPGPALGRGAERSRAWRNARTAAEPARAGPTHTENPGGGNTQNPA